MRDLRYARPVAPGAPLVVAAAALGRRDAHVGGLLGGRLAHDGRLEGRGALVPPLERLRVGAALPHRGAQEVGARAPLGRRRQRDPAHVRHRQGRRPVPVDAAPPRPLGAAAHDAARVLRARAAAARARPHAAAADARRDAKLGDGGGDRRERGGAAEPAPRLHQARLAQPQAARRRVQGGAQRARPRPRAPAPAPQVAHGGDEARQPLQAAESRRAHLDDDERQVRRRRRRRGPRAPPKPPPRAPPPQRTVAPEPPKEASRDADADDAADDADEEDDDAAAAGGASVNPFATGGAHAAKLAAAKGAEPGTSKAAKRKIPIAAGGGAKKIKGA